MLLFEKRLQPGAAYDTRPENGYVLPGILALFLLLSMTTALFAVSTEGPGSQHAPLFLALTGGLIFGAVAQRSRTCFAGGIRDVILMKNFELLSVIGGLFAVMLIYNLASGHFTLSFSGQAAVLFVS